MNVEAITTMSAETAAWVFLIVLLTLLVRYLLKRVFDRLAKQLQKTNNLYDDAVLEAARKPIGWAVWIMGILFAAQYMLDAAATDDAQKGLRAVIEPFRAVSVVALLAWFATRFIKFIEVHVADAEYRTNPIDPTTASAIGKLLRASVIITAVLLTLQNLGFSIEGVLAFGGIGGIAIGFAARDMLANFFGALMVFLDRPFSVGDWIRSPDREIEGTVEEIGWRLTLIRTFDQRPLYVPNSVFTAITVENPQRMRNRRIYETIGVRYDDIAVLPEILEDIRTYLRENEEIDKNRTLMVNFVTFGESSVDFFIYTFTKTTVWVDFHAIKEVVLLEIANIISNHGAEIAFPTSTVQLHPPLLAEPLAGPQSQ